MRGRRSSGSASRSTPPTSSARPTRRPATCFLTVGTSAVVYPAAGFARQARSRGAFTAEINLEPTPASSVVDLSILGAAEEVLPVVDRLLASG